MSNPDMRKCDGCGVNNLCEDLVPGKNSKVYCRSCKRKGKK